MDCRWVEEIRKFELSLQKWYHRNIHEQSSIEPNKFFSNSLEASFLSFFTIIIITAAAAEVGDDDYVRIKNTTLIN